MRRARSEIAAILALCLSALTGGIAQTARAQSSGTPAGAYPDSLRSFSPEELMRYRQFYQREIARLEEEIRQLRDHGIQDSEDFLSRHPESKVVDKILLRLAEFYYYQTQEDFQRRMEEYEQLLARHDRGELAELPPEPKKDYHRALSLYRTLIEQFPQSKYVDDALYNTAFLMEDEGRQSEALQVYQELIDQFPQSPYVPEALMRMAEYYFHPPVNQIEKAIELYQKILAFHDTPRYDEALYRLGWCYFRLGDYPRAISYFTLLADDINLAKQYDRDQKISNPALQEESIEYIGISFLDFGGPERAARYIREIGDREYGFTILKKIGDVYFDEKEEFGNAIEAYRVLLSLYPNHPKAPEIQNRIVLACRKLQDDGLAMQERLRLFEQYGPGGPWWQQNRHEKDALRTAELLARSALADNLSLLLAQATEQNSPSLYREYVRQARIFLEHFAGDSLAPQIHWNLALILDTKLGERDEAFRQYLSLSNTYLGSPYQKMAAENAVALAKEMVEGGTDSASAHRGTLSEPEKRLVEAYDNFIRLFPDDPETGLMLAGAGALFYNHRQFDEALRYFKTLVNRFPQSEYLETARLTIVESYFGKKDYRSTEIAAKRILSTTQTDELRQKAKRRLAEAIFLTADSLSRQGEHRAAGKEFARVAAEVPDIDFADLALFKAGTEFDQAQDFATAVSVYEKLLADYPDSRYKLDAMNNLALDYGELKRYGDAALTYEKLADLHPDSTRAQDALYNAGAFYVRAEDWRSAIRVNRRFVERYPRSREADDLFFDIASYYLKLGELASANQIYGEYAERFPNSPRVVESYFRRGEYYRALGDLSQAKAEFEKAIQHASMLQLRGLEANDYFHAEALFALTELKYAEYTQIAFRLPEESLRQSKRRKADLLKELVDAYAKVARFGTPRLYQSTYRIAEVYEGFADTWASQEVAETDPTRRAVKLKTIDEEAAQLYEKALSAYLEAVNVLERVAKEYAAAHPDTASREGRAAALLDTTLQAAQRWTSLAKLKANHVAYKIAEVSFEAARRLVAAPVPKELGEIAELEYWNQLYSKAVAPIVERTLAYHRRNLSLARQLSTENEWVSNSRRRIAEIGLLIPNGYQALADSALARYTRAVLDFAYLLAKADSNPNLENQIYEKAGQVGHLLDYTKSFSKTAAELGISSLAALDSLASVSGMTEEYARQFHERWSDFGLRCDSLSRQAKEWKEQALELRKRTGNYIWEDASLTFEDAQFSLEDASLSALEAAYRLAEGYKLRSPRIGPVVLCLLQKDPEKYAPLVGLSLRHDTTAADTSWHAELIDPSSPDRSVGLGRTEIVETLGNAPQPLPVLAIRGPAGSSDTTRSSRSICDSLRWRVSREISIPGLPAEGQIRVFSTSTYDLFLNGQYISHVEIEKGSQGSWHIHKLTEFLAEGPNRVELWLPAGSDTTSSRFAAELRLTFVADWQTQKYRLGLAPADPELGRLLYFHKNLIPDWQLSRGKPYEEKLANGGSGHPDVDLRRLQPNRLADEGRTVAGGRKGNGSGDDIH